MTSRSSSAQTRQQPGSEVKNSQDVVIAGSKPGKSSGSSSRGSRRREPAQSSLASLNPSKPGPRSKNAGGKRPPPRGGYHNHPRHFTTNQVDEADEYELGSIFTPGGRKQNSRQNWSNHNHLLNFQSGYTRPPHQKQRHEKHHHQQQVARPKYDQTHYLQANCQFVVRQDQDYSVQAADPDVMVDWSNIEQVHLRVASDDLTSCPICLFPPTAAKMSECGHVFCWSCILHYLALSDDDSRPCPICHQPITKPGLRSVKIISKHSYNTGECVKMTLMKRERNSLFAVPVNNNFITKHPDINNSDVVQEYVKLFTASPDQVKTEILDVERGELEKQWSEEKNEPESCFIQEALKLLDKRELETMTRPRMIKPPSPVLKKPLIPGLQTLSIKSPTSPTEFVDPFADEVDTAAAVSSPDEERPRHVSGVSSDSVSSADDVTEMISDEGVTVTDLDISTVQHQGPCQPTQVYYFYQSSDGQPIFLHSLNIKMLVTQYGSLEKCPPVIQAEILEKEGAVMSEHLRDRLKYLKHLPVSTNFDVAELEMKHLVSKETMTVFKEPLETRRRKRNRKARDEKRREKKIQHEAARQMGLNPDMVRVESDYKMKTQEATPDQTDQFPAMSAEDNNITASSPASGASFSFANITKTKPVVPQQPVAAKPATASSWMCLGSVKPLQSSRSRAVNNDSDNELETHPDYVPAPSMASLGDTLAAALQQNQAAPGGAGGKKSGRKGRGKTLLLTGGAPRPIF